MYKDILRSIEAIDIYPIIGLTIFFVFFVVVVIWVMKFDKGFIKKMSDMPLDLSTKEENNQQTT